MLHTFMLYYITLIPIARSSSLTLLITSSKISSASLLLPDVFPESMSYLAHSQMAFPNRCPLSNLPAPLASLPFTLVSFILLDCIPVT